MSICSSLTKLVPYYYGCIVKIKIEKHFAQHIWWIMIRMWSHIQIKCVQTLPYFTRGWAIRANWILRDPNWLNIPIYPYIWHFFLFLANNNPEKSFRVPLIGLINLILFWCYINLKHIKTDIFKFACLGPSLMSHEWIVGQYFCDFRCDHMGLHSWVIHAMLSLNNTNSNWQYWANTNTIINQPGICTGTWYMTSSLHWTHYMDHIRKYLISKGGKWKFYKVKERVY